ncbi:SH3 domain-containing protein [Paraburkholderia sp. BCC1886]|uniref:SH3 domain-containing protein n=1 Tax=Paraburkholderia sp. BCC1886 TaxID=2562670 RepID=UPI00391F8FC3
MPAAVLSGLVAAASSKASLRRLRAVLPGCALAALCACGNPAPDSGATRLQPDNITLFPIEHYDQNVDHWIEPDSAGYDQPFLSAADQKAHLRLFYARYFGTGSNSPSPWNAAFVTMRVYRQQGADIAALQQRRIARFDNAEKHGADVGYGENFRPHDKAWIDAIAQNMNVAQFTADAAYRPERRAIATGNLLVRELPTIDPSFYDRRLAGEGYPFDNLQISASRPGTPLYVLGSSVDGAWYYVQTPDVQGWVRSDGVAMTDDRFVDRWRAATATSLGAVTVASAPVRDSRGTFRFDAPAGTLLPLVPQGSQASGGGPLHVLVPARDADGEALIRDAELSDTQIAPMPLAATPRHLAMLMKRLIGRPYGWGNSGLNNDCSSELQSIFAVFGVWLPRHSSTQMSAGRMTDLSASSPAQRLDYLVQHGVQMRTLIYIGGHVMLYIGTTTRHGVVVPVVYQDVWGLRPADDSRRAVIGGSVILPLDEHIAEDATLQSLAGTPIFQISVLGAPPGSATSAPADDDSPAG